MNNRIVIASVLKPTDDVRGYWKIGQSLVKTNKYEVNIIGNRGKIEINEDNIQVHPHDIHRSQWLKRLALRYVILLKLVRMKPKVFIFCTHELLFVASLTKLLCNSKLVYDVQENYLLNASMNGFIGKLFGRLIRLKE